MNDFKELVDIYFKEKKSDPDIALLSRLMDDTRQK